MVESGHSVSALAGAQQSRALCSTMIRRESLLSNLKNFVRRTARSEFLNY